MSESNLNDATRIPIGIITDSTETPRLDEKETVVISFDVEATGSSPVNGSMVMLGIVVVRESAPIPDKNRKWYIDKQSWCIKEYNRRDERCMNEFWSKYPVNLRYILEIAKEPRIVAQEISNYLAELGKKYKYYFLADPASFDWAWLIDFYDRFGPNNKTNLGYKSICMDSMEKALNFMGIPHNTSEDAKAYGLQMTHMADDDAEFQAYQYLMLMNIMNKYKNLIEQFSVSEPSIK